MQEYDALKARYANAPKKRVFLQFGSAPLFTSGPGSIQDQVLALRRREYLHHQPRSWPQVSREQVLARQPQASCDRGCQPHCRSAALWQHQLTISLIALHATGLNAHVSSPPNNFVRRLTSKIIIRHRMFSESTMLVYWLDIGTAVFAISGVLLAGKLRMDPFGVLVLGSDGGRRRTIRDMALANGPVFWVKIPPIWWWRVTSMLTILLVRQPRRLPKWILPVLDAVGLAVFVGIGVNKAFSLARPAGRGVHGW